MSSKGPKSYVEVITIIQKDGRIGQHFRDIDDFLRVTSRRTEPSTEKVDWTTFDDAPDVLTVDEAVVLVRVNRKTLYEAVKDGTIPSQRVGHKCIRILKSALRDWLEGQQ